jgi:hypothetical protein
MTEGPEQRLAAALAFRAELPPPKLKRNEKILLSLTSEEKARLVALAAVRGEPPAVLARSLMLVALGAFSQ